MKIPIILTLTIICMITVIQSHAQLYLLKNEISVFSFDTKSGKHLELAKDSNDNYIVYRYGQKNKIEFEYPSKTRESWRKLNFTSQIRGGGTQNEGIDLNYVYFFNKSFQYVIYSTYFARDQRTYTGIRIFDLAKKSMIDIPAKPKSVKGSLTDLRDNDLIKVGNEFFD